MKRLYIDIETSGLNAYRNGIIQIAGIIEVDGEEKESFDFNMNVFEGDLIEDKALEINNITREQIAEFEDPKIVYSKLIALMKKYVDRYDKKDKFVFVAYNASFDNDFIRHWFKKNSDKYFGAWFWNPYIDVMTIAHHVLGDLRPEMENFKLDTVAKAFNIEINKDELHDALYDISLTRKIYRQLLSGKDAR